MRLLVQSCDTGRFLVPDLEGGVLWVRSLRDAGCGVLADPEEAVQVAQEWAEAGEVVQVVDLDRLGTADDYISSAATDAAPDARAAGVEDGGALCVHPDGNHGDNDFSNPREGWL